MDIKEAKILAVTGVALVAIFAAAWANRDILPEQNEPLHGNPSVEYQECQYTGYDYEADIEIHISK